MAIIHTLFGASELPPDHRVCKATTRFRECWFNDKLPRLSWALGICVGLATGKDAGRAGSEGGAVQNDDNEPSVSDCPVDDETWKLSAMREDRESAECDASRAETYLSKRIRRVTPRFLEGWYSEKLPRLSEALGVCKGSG